jgi:hypothetical protein
MPYQARDGFIYIISDGHTHIKVGFSCNPTKRMALLQTTNPRFLTLVRTIPSNRRTEHIIQRGLEKYRTRGEWFDITALDQAIGLLNTLDSYI